MNKLINWWFKTGWLCPNGMWILIALFLAQIFIPMAIFIILILVASVITAIGGMKRSPV